MNMKHGIGRKLGIAALGWTAAILMFFPVFWMVLTSFKPEIEAVAMPPHLFFKPTLANYVAIDERSDYLGATLNSVVISAGSTLLGLAISIPAAYSMAFFPTKHTKTLLLWILSTKMMPAVGVFVPIFLIFKSAHLIDTRIGLTMILAATNLPLIVWMLYTFFKDIPGEIVEASLMDGAGPIVQLCFVLLPLAAPGIASTALLSVILAWNEAFWTINLTAVDAAPLSAFIASFSSPEELFWAKLSAASTLAIAPILIFGWLMQRQLVRGLTFGSVK